jgi:hypothetical protein
VNSVASGPTSLESAPIARSVTPRAPSGQQVTGVLQTQALVGADGTTLDPNAALPTLDPATGIFSGPMPPADGVEVGLAAFLPELLSDGAITVTVDSIIPGADLDGRSLEYYLTGQGSGAPVPFQLSITQDAFSSDESGSANFPATNVDSAKAARFGGSQSFFLAGATTAEVPGNYRITSFGRGDINGDPSNSVQAGPRWWSGAANETQSAPNSTVCTPSSGSCVQADLSHTAGELPGVSVLFHIMAYATVASTPMRNLEGLTAGVTRAADFALYWGSGGAIDSVIDLTHHVPVPFSDKIRASWGVLNQAGFAGTTASSTSDGNNALLTWTDIFCVDPAPSYLGQCGGSAQTPAVLSQTAQLSPVAAQSSSVAGSASLTQTGTGFILYLNGHWFVMQMASLPTAGTVWNARYFTGSITGTAAAGDYEYTPAIRPAAVPGLQIQLSYSGSSLDATVTTDSLLARVHTVPDPYYVTNPMEIAVNRKVLRFVNLPAQAIIRIYSLSGVLVNVLEHNDPTGGGETTWNLRNRNNQFVASGVYFYHVETPDGKGRVGRFTVVNFAQ